MATNKRDRWFFVFGFEKNEQANVSPKELAALQLYAADLLKLSAKQLDTGVAEDKFQEICNDDDKGQSEEPPA